MIWLATISAFFFLLLFWKKARNVPPPSRDFGNTSERDAADDITNTHATSESDADNHVARLMNMYNDADAAVMFYQEILSPSRVSLVGFLLVLADVARSRFEESGDPAHINKSLNFTSKAAETIQTGYGECDVETRARLYHVEGLAFYARSEIFGALGDIESAIAVWKQALDLTDDENADNKAVHLKNIGNALCSRFEHLGERSDIDEAVIVHRQAIDLTPDDHADRSSRLNSLGNALARRFERFGKLADIDNAIVIQQQAVTLTPDDHTEKPTWLNNLGSSLARRFAHLGDLPDINNAIIAQRQAVDLTPDGHVDKPSRLMNLGGFLRKRFERVGEVSDINGAVDAQRQGIHLMPDDHAEKPPAFGNLGNSLLTRFKRLGELPDIENAVNAQQKAVDLSPDGHVEKPSRLNGLGNGLLRRHQHSGEPLDLDNSIVMHKQAVILTAEGQADKPSLLYNLGNSSLIRYQRLGAQDDLDIAISSFSTAATSISGSTTYQYHAAREWARLLHPALGPHRAVISLIPRVVWLGRTVQQRYKDLETLGDAVMEAASAACAAGEYELALEWLEQGRAIVWGQILHLRSPMDALQAAHPELANELSAVAVTLETAGTINSGLIVNESSAEELGQKHRRLAERWETLLGQVRALPNFHDFLRPKSASVLRTVSRHSTIVIVNISQYQSDALILQPESPSIHNIPLTNVTLVKLKAARDSFFKSLHSSGVRVREAERKSGLGRSVTSGALTKILAMLWDDIAGPILRHLGHSSPPTGKLPRITWCLTGPLASLPLHAAGIYDGSKPGSKLFNYVVSSYTPSLTPLLEMADKIPSNSPGVLAVAQATTPGLSFLPGTTKEVDEVEGQMRHHANHLTRIDGNQATVATVSAAMDSYEWVHLSCHAKQDAVEPTKSAFHLQDGTLELAEIMKKPLKHAELAYLSACQTASGDATLPDEAVHLAAGMFIAGYRSVVATLWSINDNEAPLVARIFYDRLLSNPEDGASQALHDAVGELRKQSGEKNFLSWVPYIHIGR